jgi:hypothetical protein
MYLAHNTSTTKSYDAFISFFYINPISICDGYHGEGITHLDPTQNRGRTTWSRHHFITQAETNFLATLTTLLLE